MKTSAWLVAGRRSALCLLQVMLLVVGLMTQALAGETITYFHNDVAGSPALATDSNGAIIWRETYHPYGDRLIESAASVNNSVWFTGKPYDSSTGLSYMGARYYDPMLGRFMGIDPAPVDFDNLHSLNRYAYANNNPYKFVDPDGNSPVDVVFLVYDVGKLGVALYTGVGVQGALIDVASSVVGVASPIPGTGQAIKAARAVDKVVDTARAADNAVDAVRATDNAADGARKVPNPWGKNGGPAHQAKVEDIVRDIEARGLKAEREYAVKTPNGNKKTRYLDVVGKDADDKVVETHQVGRQTKKQQPVSRENKAMDDIEGATGKRPKFHPYN